MSAPTCGELSCDECSARTAALTAERDQLRAEVERLKGLASWAHTCIHHNDEQRAKAKSCPVCATTERDQLRAEVERLGADRDCEKRLRKDADEFRENAIARAARAEDNLAALEQCHDDNCRGVVRIAADLATERARMADLVADLNDACITLESAKNDCDDYAMQNTAFKLMAVGDVLLQYIPNAAMKEETK